VAPYFAGNLSFFKGVQSEEGSNTAKHLVQCGRSLLGLANFAPI